MKNLEVGGVSISCNGRKEVNSLPNNQNTLTKSTVKPIPPDQFKSNILKGQLYFFDINIH